MIYTNYGRDYHVTEIYSVKEGAAAGNYHGAFHPDQPWNCLLRYLLSTALTNFKHHPYPLFVPNNFQ